MLTAGDDYPIHQTPEPVALVTDRNFYDRYFFNGSTPDGRIFFAAAMGIYPALDVIDSAFCVMIDGVQHNLRASARLYGDRMALCAGPISIAINVALWDVTLRIAPNDGATAADLRFTGRHFPIEEPRFTRRIGTRLFMDYTRMTQNGRWAGWIDVAGERHSIDADCVGTRDRSWGIRPVGKADSQPAVARPASGTGDAPLPQFFWLWTPCNFDAHAVYFHSNDDAAGHPWNRRAVIARDGDGRDAVAEFAAPACVLDWYPGTRRVARAVVDLGPDSRLTLTPVSGPAGTPRHFYMNGLGYTHPVWGHGMDHGDHAVTHDVIDSTVADGDYANMHVQALADAVLEHDGGLHRGRGVIEQMFIGPHQTSGLTGLFDPHG